MRTSKSNRPPSCYCCFAVVVVVVVVEETVGAIHHIFWTTLPPGSENQGIGTCKQTLAFFTERSISNADGISRSRASKSKVAKD